MGDDIKTSGSGASRSPGNRPAKDDGGGVLGAASWVAAGTLSSRILGLFRDILMAAALPRYLTDAWLVAFRIPNLFRRLFGEGSLSVAFIPVLIRELGSGDRRAVQELISSIFSILLIVLIGVTSLGFIFAEEVVAVLTPGEGFRAVPGKVELTVDLLRIMIFYLILVCNYAFFMALHNSIKKFAIPAFAPALLNVAIITGILLGRNNGDSAGTALAFAVLVGGVLQVLMVLPTVFKNNLVPKIFVKLSSPSVRTVLRNIVPSLIGLGVLQLTVLVNTRFASFLPEGANSWIFWADRLLEFPLSLVAVSMGTALLPSLSERYSRGDTDGMSRLLNQSLRYVLAFAIPAGVGIFVLGELLVETIFLRGEFSSVDAANTSAVLKIYGAAIFTYSTIRIMQPAFYAVYNTWLPAVVSAGCLVLHYFVASQWVHKYGIEGLASSSVLSALVNMTLLFVFYRTMVAKFDFVALFKVVLKIVLASGAMGLLVYKFDEFWQVDEFYFRLIKLSLLVVIGAGSYFLCSLVLKLEEAQSVMRRVLLKLRLLPSSK